MDDITLKLNSPITEEQWDAITDVDFDHTDRIWFSTKNGKEVEFIKPVFCKDCKHREYDEDFGYMCEYDTGDPYCTGRNAEDDEWFCADAERRQDDVR